QARADEPVGVRDRGQRPPGGDRPPEERRAHRRAGGRAPVPAAPRAHPAQGVPPRAVRSARQVRRAMPDAKETPEAADPEARRDPRVTINKEFESYDAFINEYVTNIS